MPVKITKNKDGTYKVSTPNMVHAKHTTLEKAKKQGKIINAADAGHPIGGKKKVK
jgi:hypothetical protein